MLNHALRTLLIDSNAPAALERCASENMSRIARGFYVRLLGVARLWARLAPPFTVEWRFLGSGDWRGRCCESMR